MLGEIRILIADDHTLVREGLGALLSGSGGLRVVGQAKDGQEAIQKSKELQPDVVLMDISMPSLNGIDATRLIRQNETSPYVLLLSMHCTEEFVIAASQSGASGFVVKGADVGELETAVRTVAEGGAYFSPPAAKILLSGEGSQALSGRERQVLQLVGEGHSSAKIAQQLGLSVKTIERHRSRLMSKLNVSNVAGMVRHAIRLGLVDPSRD